MVINIKLSLQYTVFTICSWFVKALYQESIELLYTHPLAHLCNIIKHILSVLLCSRFHPLPASPAAQIVAIPLQQISNYRSIHKPYIVVNLPDFLPAPDPDPILHLYCKIFTALPSKNIFTSKSFFTYLIKPSATLLLLSF